MLEVFIATVDASAIDIKPMKTASVDWELVNLIVGTILALIGLWIGIYTLRKVKRVERAQTEARKVTQKLLGVDNIESDYLKMMMFLSQSQEADSKTLLIELSLRLGSIRGIRKMLSVSGLGDESISVTLEKGYFSQDFLIENIDRSMSHIDILTGRSQMISNFPVMEKLRIACERGVKVRLVTLCENAEEPTLEDSLQTVAFPAPASSKDYREQLKQCTKDITDTVKAWRPNARANFQYSTSKSVPRISSVRADDYVNLGFLQLYREAQPRNTFEREYIKISTSSETGRVLMKHFDCVLGAGTPVTF